MDGKPLQCCPQWHILVGSDGFRILLYSSEYEMKSMCIESNHFFALSIQFKSLFYIRKAEFML